MSSSLTIKLDTIVESKDRTVDTDVRRTTETNAIKRSVTDNQPRFNGSSSAMTSKPRLGETVRHSRYGKGRVLAHWPDGTLLIRFGNEAKNRLVSPSLLYRMNGQRRLTR